jgi:hypothetical protein
VLLQPSAVRSPACILIGRTLHAVRCPIALREDPPTNKAASATTPSGNQVDDDLARFAPRALSLEARE